MKKIAIPLAGLLMAASFGAFACTPYGSNYCIGNKMKNLKTGEKFYFQCTVKTNLSGVYLQASNGVSMKSENGTPPPHGGKWGDSTFLNNKGDITKFNSLKFYSVKTAEITPNSEIYLSLFEKKQKPSNLFWSLNCHQV